MTRSLDGLLPRLLIDAILPCALAAIILTAALTVQRSLLLVERQRSGVALQLERLGTAFAWENRSPQQILDRGLRDSTDQNVRYIGLELADGRLYGAGQEDADAHEIYARVLPTPQQQALATITMQVDPWPLRRAQLLTWGGGALCIVGISLLAVLARSSLRRRIIEPLHRLQHALDDLLPRRDECGAAEEMSGDEMARLHASLTRIDQALNTQRRDLVAIRRANALQSIRQQREAQALNRSKSHFIALVGHHFRQPLQALQLFTAFLRLGNDKEQQSVLAQMRGSIGSMTRLLDALLEISRLDAGVISPNPAPFTAAELFLRHRQSLTELAAQQHVALVWRGGHHRIHADAELCGRLLQQLISNAVASTPNGRVLIAARRQGDRVRIEVRDNGPGIAAAQHQRIFEEFVRIEGDEGDAHEGYGLGLSIAERLAQILDTHIGLRSEPGRGSTFWFDLPKSTISGHNHRLPPEPMPEAWRHAS
jgi:signal transduction histidine kinase